MTLRTFAIPVLLLAATAAHVRGGDVLEADAYRASDSQIIDDASASGQHAVSNAHPWQPLIELLTPKDAGPVNYIWLRHRHAPIQLKTIAGGQQTERDWIWADADTWSWSRIGPYAAADLGETLRFVRGPRDGEVAIDALQITADADFIPKGRVASGPKRLPPDRPDADAPAVNGAVSIDWDRIAGEVPAAIWGVNDYEVEKPDTAADPKYHALLRQINPPVIRVHRASLPAAWLKPDGKTFDTDLIKQSFDGIRPGYAKAPLMISIAAWPDAMTDPAHPGVIAAEHEDDFAAMCVDLMRALRTAGQPVAYWEVTNERDNTYEKAGKLDDLWRLYNKCYAAMKQFDPSAKVGGAALTWAKPAWVDGFVANCVKPGHADFVTYHHYGIGDVNDDNEALFARLDSFESSARYVRAAVDRASAGRARIPVFCDEYNVKWTWEPVERRHFNSVGAAFQAGVVHRLATAGIDGAMVWQTKGNAYGLVSGDDVPNLTFSLYTWGPKHLVGKLAPVRSDVAGLEILPVTRADGGRAVLLANTTDHTINLPAIRELLGQSVTPHAACVTADGVTVPTIDTAGSLAGYSITLLSTLPIEVRK